MLQTYGFTVGKKSIYWMHPHEDAFAISEKQDILAVADGITRDPCRTLKEGLLGKIYMELLYPRPSPAKIAAEHGVNAFVEGPFRPGMPFNTVMERITNANEVVNLRANIEFGLGRAHTDYLLDDLGGCTLAGVIRKKNSIEFGVLAPCGVAVVSNEGKIVYKTEDTFWENDSERWKYLPLSNHVDKKGNPKWNLPGTRQAIRRYCRNEPEQPHAFGVLTGEEEALQFVQLGKRELVPTDRLLLYTDGMADVLFKKNGKLKEKILKPAIESCIRDNDLRALQQIAQRDVRTEGTLIYQAPWIHPSP